MTDKTASLDFDWTLPDPGPLVAELLDEADPEGPVVLKREKDGSLVAVMPQSLFWALRDGKDAPDGP